MFSKDKYSRNKDDLVWCKSSSIKSFYSDGEENENLIYQLLLKCKDRSVHSEELTKLVSNWPTLIAFSPKRGDLLRPLNILPQHSVLEIGAGFGGITRYIGEIGCNVVALEPSYNRAKVAALRNEDLTNVKVVCDSLDSFNATSQFDIVIVVGVLEYADLFYNDSNGHLTLLKECRKHVKEGGTFVLAIENKLGLKYFNGLPEDHLNESYVGIEDRYTEFGPKTWGFKEVSRKLLDVGFSRISYYLPFPDYKLPSTIITESGVNDINFKVAELLGGKNYLDLLNSKSGIFQDSFVWRAIEDNELMPDLSNSFVFVCGEKEIFRDLLGVHVTSGRDLSKCTITEFQSYGESIQVSKRITAPNSSTASLVVKNFSHKISALCPYIQGELLWLKFARRVASDGLSSVVILSELKPWVDFLLTNLNEGRLSGDFLDAVPFNMVIDKGGKLQPFDLEWIYNGSLQIEWVVLRGVYYSLIRLCLDSKGLDNNIEELLVKSVDDFGLNLENFGGIKRFIELEGEFLKFVTNNPDQTFKLPDKLNDICEKRSLLTAELLLEWRNRALVQERENANLRGTITTLEGLIQEAEERNAYLNRRLLEFQVIIQGILSSLSWKITTHLRILKKLACSLK